MKIFKFQEANEKIKIFNYVFTNRKIEFKNYKKLKIKIYYILFYFSNLNVNVKTIIYDEMPHGFLSYDAPQGMSEAKKCVEDAANCIQELINF